MSWIIVIEQSQDFQNQIQEALVQIDPTIVVVSFPRSKEFMEWLTLLSQNDPAVTESVPKDQFKGLITAIETWNFKDIQLIEKFRPLFVQRGFATAEDELCVVLTGFDSPGFDKRRYEQRFVNNFLYKPFDKLLLKQMLEIAFTGRHPVAKYYIHNLKTEIQIEMLKEIRLSEVTEIGFETISDQKVDTKKVAKYYANFLETNQHRSALARAFNNTPIPNTELNRVELGFFALDQQQSFNLQKTIQSRKQTRPIPGTKGATELYEFIFLQHENTDLCQQIQPSIERFFEHPSTSVNSLEKLAQLFQTLEEKKENRKRLVFIDSTHIFGNEAAEVQTLIRLGEKVNVSLYLLSPRIFPEALEFELSALVGDIFYAPFNRSYIVKTLKRSWPDLRNREEIFENHGEWTLQIHVSNPVKVIEVSEAGLIMEYHRELAVGTFREFIFWMPNEVAVPELLGQCNFCEPTADKKAFNCHFIFFGLQDIQLKHMRLWMLHNYIAGKGEEG